MFKELVRAKINLERERMVLCFSLKLLETQTQECTQQGSAPQAACKIKILPNIRPTFAILQFFSPLKCKKCNSQKFLYRKISLQNTAGNFVMNLYFIYFAVRFGYQMFLFKDFRYTYNINTTILSPTSSKQNMPFSLGVNTSLYEHI